MSDINWNDLTEDERLDYLKDNRTWWYLYNTSNQFKNDFNAAIDSMSKKTFFTGE